MNTMVLTVSSAGQFITVLLIFAFVLFITLFTTKYIGSFQKEKSQGRNVKILETQRISQNKYIQLVEIGGRVFAMVVCKDTVTMISELDKESLDFSSENAESISFKDFFSKAKEKEKDN